MSYRKWIVTRRDGGYRPAQIDDSDGIARTVVDVGDFFPRSKHEALKVARTRNLMQLSAARGGFNRAAAALALARADLEEAERELSSESA